MKTKNILLGILLLVFLVNFDVIAQKKVEKYAMFTTVEMKAVRGKEKALESAVKAHNAKFHTADPHKAWLEVVVTGSNSGDYIWIMGPSMFSDLDSRPEDANHENDWNSTVDPHVKKYGSVDYWKMNNKLSFTAPDADQNKMGQIWFIDIEKGKWEEFNATLEKAVAVSKKKGDESIHLYSNQFNDGSGRDVALVFNFKSWSDLDIDDPFMKHYEAMYGKDSWKSFITAWDNSIAKMSQHVWKIVD